VVDTTTVDWWMSSYDATWHAFPGDQLTEPGRSFLSALYDHSVPRALTERTPPTGIDRLCPPCVMALGASLQPTYSTGASWTSNSSA
jgi:hypothetical protein